MPHEGQALLVTAPFGKSYLEGVSGKSAQHSDFLKRTKMAPPKTSARVPRARARLDLRGSSIYHWQGQAEQAARAEHTL